jgi:hypothetical protein
METCNVCGVVLTKQNFLSSRAKRHDYICILCGRARAKTNYYKNRDHVHTQKKIWYKANQGRKTKFEREKYARLKFEVLLHYTQVFDPTATSPHCNDPFHKHLPNDPLAKDIRALSIDHINGGGNKHLKEIGQGKLYSWLKKHNYPPGYQVLCMSCQFIKRSEMSETH